MYLKSTHTINRHMVKSKNLKSSLPHVIPAAICRKDIADVLGTVTQKDEHPTLLMTLPSYST